MRSEAGARTSSPPTPDRSADRGRGELVPPGAARLRLPVPFPGVPHGNAWAIPADGSVTLIDTGVHAPGSLTRLVEAMTMVDLDIDRVRNIVLTHTHVDHCGQAAPIAARTGAEIWCHPDRLHIDGLLADPRSYWRHDAAVERRSGIPESDVRARLAEVEADPIGLHAGLKIDHALTDGVEIPTDLGPFVTIETPGHTPSHVALFHRDERILIAGDQLLGGVSLFFDFGFSPDPVTEFLASLDRIEALDVRLVLPGHGRPFTNVTEMIEANRRQVAAHLADIEQALAGPEPQTAAEISPAVFGMPLTPINRSWLLQMMLALLTHLERDGRIEQVDQQPDRFRLT